MSDNKHSILGPSSATRWMGCPGSIRLINESDRPQVQSRAAAHGSAAHAVLEYCLNNDCDALQYPHDTIEFGEFSFLFDDEMQQGVQIALDFVQDYRKKNPEAELLIEHRLSSERDESAFGTADIIIHDKNTLLIADFKYGAGVFVEAESTQNKIYGAMALECVAAESIRHVKLCIIQPRIPNTDGLIRIHDITAKELSDWYANVVLPAMKETRNPDAILRLGDWCRWCPARLDCPAARAEVNGFDFSLKPNALKDDELGSMMDKVARVRSFEEGLFTEAYGRLVSGSEVPGYKLVKKKSIRKWTDKPNAELELKEKYGENAFNPPTLRSPAQVEKLPGGKEFVSDRVSQDSTGHSVVPNTDRRTAVNLSADAFSNLPT